MKKIITLLSLFLLASCQRDLSYDYLMQHPKVLQKAYENCRNEMTAQCDTVVRAAEDFRGLVQQRAEDPEAFGTLIMQAQQKDDQQKVRTLYAVVRATSLE